MEGPPTVAFKVLLVGPAESGKTSLFSQFNNEYSADRAPNATVGVNFKFHARVLPDGTRCTIQFHDTAGSKRFESVVTSYYRSVHAVMVIIDLSELERSISDEQKLGADMSIPSRLVHERLASLQRVLERCEGSEREPPIIYVIGTKTDRFTPPLLAAATGRAELMRRAAAFHATYYDACAPDRTSAIKPFDDIIAALITEYVRDRDARSHPVALRPMAPEWARSPACEPMPLPGTWIGLMLQTILSIYCVGCRIE